MLLRGAERDKTAAERTGNADQLIAGGAGFKASPIFVLFGPQILRQLSDELGQTGEQRFVLGRGLSFAQRTKSFSI